MYKKCSVTDNFKSNIGVRQGVNLNPSLFKLFINDLPGIFNCLIYADDLVLISKSAEGLQKCIDNL
jgi:hypothetical protein